MSKKNDPRLHRKFLRAPLKSHCLYVDGEHVFKAKVLNVSEGGILISELPHIPEINAIPLAIELPVFPKLQNLPLEQLKLLNQNEFPRLILKTKTRLARTFGNKSAVDKVFVNFIGCEFYNISPEIKESISLYIETFTRNTVYLLSLFESLGNRTEQLETLKLVAQLMGYDRNMNVPLLRAKVLHDYQSLESL